MEQYEEGIALAPSEVVADNVHDYRALRRLSQRQLAESMRELSHRWHQQSVSEVEAGRRPVTVDELVALAIVLGVTITDLLDPRGPGRPGGEEAGWYIGDETAGGYLPPPVVRALLLGVPLTLTEDRRVQPSMAPRYRAALAEAGLIDYHEEPRPPWADEYTRPDDKADR